jgi:hypothetical protein
MDAGSLFWQTKGSPHFWNYRGPLGRKKGTFDDVKRSWEKVADRLSKSGWTWGCVATVDREGRTIWIVDAHRDDRKRFVVRAGEKLTAFLELESAIRAANQQNQWPRAEAGVSASASAVPPKEKENTANICNAGV